MSLVAAYGSSDESETSETENEKEAKITPVSGAESSNLFAENCAKIQGQAEAAQNQNHDADHKISESDGEKLQHQPSQSKLFDTLLKGNLLLQFCL